MSKHPKSIDLSKALAEVSNPPKPKRVGPQKNKKPPLPQKKRTSIEHNKTRKIKERTNLAHITKAIIAEGGTVPDIGVILGCAASEGSNEWVKRLKAEGLSLVEFLEIARQRADIELVRIATKVALGYEYEEEKQESMPEYDKSGQPTGKYILGKKTVNIKRERDTTLLKFLLACRMPEYFMERKEIKIDKRVVEIREDARAEIMGFCSGLLKAIGKEVIDGEFVESEIGK
ncbi:hypothetical protein LCGC14_1049760 [marine sediment metagenome]|uniref:Uncharacterized protein n=1 Tax=marine sediment metagenome TaxID=412755 RepID=A0A0F9NB09_9ZZZZ